jgi:hypothetical protein
VDDEPTAAERSLAQHLALLRDEPPRPAPALAGRIVRTARWQRAVRAPLRVAGLLAASLTEGVGILLGRRERRGS